MTYEDPGTNSAFRVACAVCGRGATRPNGRCEDHWDACRCCDGSIADDGTCADCGCADGCDWVTAAGTRCGGLLVPGLTRCMRHATAERDGVFAAYFDYVAACEAENLDAHGFEAWEIHGRPTGPLG